MTIRHQPRVRPAHLVERYTASPPLYQPRPVTPGYREPVPGSGDADQQVHALDGSVIVEGTITAPLFAETLQVIMIEAGEPALPDDDYPANTIIFDTVAQTLKKTEDGTTWKAIVNTTDITGTITETQIADDSISTAKIQANAITAGKILAGVIDTDHLAANAVTAGKIEAGAIGADQLAATIVLASIFKTASSGTRIEFDSNGIRAYNGTNLIVNIPTNGDDVYIDAEVQASALTVSGNAVLQGGANELAAGSTLTLYNGVADPSVAPTLTQGWDTFDLTVYGGAPNDIDYSASGGAGGATACFYSVELASGVLTLVEYLASDGSVNRSLDISGDIPGGNAVGVASHGNYLYVSEWAGDTVVRYTRSTMTKDTTYSGVSMPVTFPRFPAICSDGANLFIVDLNSSGVVCWNKYDADMAKVGSTVTTDYDAGVAGTVEVLGCAAGNFDFGAWRMVVVGRFSTAEAHVFNSTGVHQTNDCFPTASANTNAVLYCNFDSTSSRFLTFTENGTTGWPTQVAPLQYHTTWNWSTASSIYWVGYTWRDDNDQASGTAAAATNLITSTAHGLAAGDIVRFNTLTGGTGLTADTPYYVIATGLTANAFSVSTTDGGAAVDITVDYSALTFGTHETAISPRNSITMGRRKKLTVTVPTLPGAGGVDDPDTHRIYIYPNATAPATTLLDLQDVGSPLAATVDITSYDNTGAAPPTVNGFPGGTPAEITSAGGEWALYGDGTVVMPTPIVTVYGNSGSPHTWTKPAGLSHVVVEVVGGGGAGGGSGAPAAGANSKGSGGGAGSYSRKLILAASLGSTETVTVGAGGTGSAAANGGNGGNSSFGTHCTANGGDGGLYLGGSTANFYGGRGGNGGAVGTGDVALAGAPGGICAGGTLLCVSGNGAPGPWGGGGPAGGSGAANQGAAGTAAGTTDYGAGGGGAYATSTYATTKAGGAGAQGCVIVTEYYAG